MGKKEQVGLLLGRVLDKGPEEVKLTTVTTIGGS